MTAALDLLTPFAVIGATMMLGIMSPGPSFVLVARTAAAAGRGAGLAASLGMGLGGAIFAALAMLGLHLVLTAVPTLYIALQACGATYLAYLAFLMWRGATTPVAFGTAGEAPPESSAARNIAIGLGTQLGNPKTAIVYGSVFASVMPAETSLGFGWAVVLLLFLLEFGWYAAVALFFSSDVMQRRYARSKVLFDRVAASAMGALGLKILFDLALRAQRSVP